MIDVKQIAERQMAWTTRWHESLTCRETEAPWTFIEANHYQNFEIWHEEDIARRDDISAERIREAKRKIDRCNQARNNSMEDIDDWISSVLRQQNIPPGERLHSETPGMMLDRLSILALKEFHMAEETVREDASNEHRQKCLDRVQILREQRNDLAGALGLLLDDLLSGRGRFKIYRQFKMYNDKDLNPQLYKGDS